MAGVPARVAVPLPLSVKVTPLGSAPDLVTVGGGTPLVVTVKLLALPTVKVALFGLVMVGAPELTVSVKLCDAFGRTPLAAVMVNG